VLELVKPADQAAEWVRTLLADVRANDEGAAFTDPRGAVWLPGPVAGPGPLRRKAVLPPGLGQEVRAWAARGKLDPAHIESLRGNSPLGALLASALDVRQRPRDEIRERVEDVGRHIAHRMERFLSALGTIAGVAPLVGFTGTVTGMIRAFMDIQALQGNVNPSVLAGGIWEALITTATGLIVGIIAYGFYNYLIGRINRMVFELENASADFIDLLQSPTPKKQRSEVHV
jgi:biopolymer transport protein ExbB